MGACDFRQKGTGRDLSEAFATAVQRAQYDHGHGGYTGTLAEKHSVVVIEPPADCVTDKQKRDYAWKLIENDDPRIDDKWGPAGAIRLDDEGGRQVWLFFGWASS